MTTTTEMKNTLSKAKSPKGCLLGQDSDGTKYFLSLPSWDCEWYWGFGYVQGYLGGKHQSHEHISSSFMGASEYYDTEKRCFRKGEYVHNLYDCKKLVQTTFSEKEGWELSELFNQFYFLKEAAENFGRGKCYTASANIPLWQDKGLSEKINKELIPTVTARILEILSPSNH